jgi:hypothetical protein
VPFITYESSLDEPTRSLIVELRYMLTVQHQQILAYGIDHATSVVDLSHIVIQPRTVSWTVNGRKEV